MLTEIERIDQIAIESNGILQVRKVIETYSDGVFIKSENHRSPVVPGQDLTGLDPKVVAVAQIVHTPEVITAYQASIQSQFN